MPMLLRSAASKTIMLMVLDSSTGLPKTGLAFGDVATAAFVRNREAAVTFSAITLASPSAAYASGGFVEIDSTNMPGLYRLDIPDAALAGTPDQTVIYLTFTPADTNAQPVQIDMNHQDFTDFALEVDTIAELAQAVPLATPTIKKAIMLLYMMARNKLTSDATLQEINNDAGVVIVKSTLAFDVPTQKFTRSKLVVGP